jgi:hypothetical protein
VLVDFINNQVGLFMKEKLKLPFGAWQKQVETGEHSDGMKDQSQ